MKKNENKTSVPEIIKRQRAFFERMKQRSEELKKRKEESEARRAAEEEAMKAAEAEGKAAAETAETPAEEAKPKKNPKRTRKPRTVDASVQAEA